MPGNMAVDHRRRLMRSRGERIQSFAFVMSMFICVLLCVVFLPGVRAGPEELVIELESRINPNNAPISSLVRLPGIGPSRAAAIVAYRERQVDRPGAFADCNDLQNVKGIGPKTAQSICEWLKFE